ncbi:MAG: WYL domain-containing protein [Muribaculaceae bacterium]|nr:WYL domain-containing protein [Roseburia sp.]MCM1430191.1 WYL domain-containing protein [Muribaculaceae bacterium]MCM1493121.1 WYL domain-containing protein [Muribaculaceae bacterium]
MPKSENQKQKILYIEKLLRERTDVEHTLTTPQIISYLEQQGIRAERKSIYSDIQTLRDFGLDITRDGNKRGGYRLDSREFELAEVKLLVDLVQSARFITTKKSRELIAKLESLVSQPDARALRRQVVVADRNKTANESIYYNVDLIHAAIAENTQIEFQYFEWDAQKKMALRKGGLRYQVSPWLLLWDDENYYLVAYDASAGLMKHYRVDKMLHPAQTDRPRDGRKLFEEIDVAAYTKKTFGMFAGEECTVQLLCSRSLTGVIIDRFGRDVALRPYDGEHILVRADVEVSPQFYGWLAGLSDRVQILSPKPLAAAYQEYLANILSKYREEET